MSDTRYCVIKYFVNENGVVRFFCDGIGTTGKYTKQMSELEFGGLVAELWSYEGSLVEDISEYKSPFEGEICWQFKCEDPELVFGILSS